MFWARQWSWRLWPWAQESWEHGRGWRWAFPSIRRSLGHGHRPPPASSLRPGAWRTAVQASTLFCCWRAGPGARWKGREKRRRPSPVRKRRAVWEKRARQRRQMLAQGRSGHQPIPIALAYYNRIFWKIPKTHFIQIFEKKFKQIIQKLNNLPTKTNIFFISPEFNGFCRKVFAQTQDFLVNKA